MIFWSIKKKIDLPNQEWNYQPSDQETHVLATTLPRLISHEGKFVHMLSYTYFESN